MSTNNLQAVIEFSIELHKFVNIDLFQRGYYQIRVNHKVQTKLINKVETQYSKFSRDSVRSREPDGVGSSSSLSNLSGPTDERNRRHDGTSNIVFPPCIVNGSAVSQTFQILYKNEEVHLNDVISFKTHVVVDGSHILDQLKRVNFILNVELWFTDQDFGPDHHNSVECVSSRQLVLHFDVQRGIHSHLPVIFDYFHLCALTLSVHGSLTTLCQPYIRYNHQHPHTHHGHHHGHHHSHSHSHGHHTQHLSPRNTSKSSSTSTLSTNTTNGSDTSSSATVSQSDQIGEYDSLLFGCSMSNLKDLEWSEMQLRIRRAQVMHWQMCGTIFAAIHSLERKLHEYRCLSTGGGGSGSGADSRKTSVKPSSRSMSLLAQACYKSSRSDSLVNHQNEFFSKLPSEIRPSDYVTLVESDLAYLSGLCILQWEQFLKAVVHSDRIATHLGKIHHNQRIKRFAESFFIIEKPRESLISVCDTTSAMFTEVSESCRKSPYFALLPPCDVECMTLDGDSSSLPIIYEERYEVVVGATGMNVPAIYVSHSDVGSSSKGGSQSSLAGIPPINKQPTRTRTPTSLMSPTNHYHHSHPSSPNRSNNRSHNSSPDSARSGGESGPNSRTHSPSSSCSERHHRPRPTSSGKDGRRDRDSCSVQDVRTGEEESAGKEISSLRGTVTISDLNHHSSSRDDGHSLKSKSEKTLCFSTSSKPMKPRKDRKTIPMPSTPSDKKLPYSESLPDLSSMNVSRSRNRNKQQKTLTSSMVGQEALAEEVFQGTTYFPRPPPEFTSEPRTVSSSPRIRIRSDPTCSDDKLSGGGPRSPNASQNHQFEGDMKEEGEEDQPNEDILVIKEGEVFSPSPIPSPGSIRKKEADSTGTPNVVLNRPPTNSSHKSSVTRSSSGSGSGSGSTGRHLSGVSSQLISFLEAKEEFRREKATGWIIYSDLPKLPSRIPYFQYPNDMKVFSPRDHHLIVCVHGLDGNSGDLRLIKAYLELGLPSGNLEFLMSHKNHGQTFDCFETLTDRLVKEIIQHIQLYRLNPTKISFIGHSLGNIIIRSAVSRPEMKPYLSRLYTFLSLSGPHLGTGYNSSGLVNMGLWVFQKWKKSASLQQLSMKDNSDPRETFLYKLSSDPSLGYFKHILLCGSSQDNYVPVHSAHIEVCSSALNDTSVNGMAYKEMVSNILHPLITKDTIKIFRFDVHHAFTSSANSLIGRAAHIAVLDSELFIEKFMTVCGLKYFS